MQMGCMIHEYQTLMHNKYMKINLQELSGEPVDIDDYITGLERELDRRAKRTERKLSQPLVENERQQVCSP